jgi:hypothetical protein
MGLDNNKMSTNQILGQLHMERLARLTPQASASASALGSQVTAEPVAFECPVCYTDGGSSGVVDPGCSHKICVTCYSTILMNETRAGRGHTAKCPCCRTAYLMAASATTDADADADLNEMNYDDMPPLIEAAALYEYTNHNRLRVYDEIWRTINTQPPMAQITIDEMLQVPGMDNHIPAQPVHDDISDVGILYTLLNGIANLIPNNNINNYNNIDNLMSINATDHLIAPNYNQTLPDPPVQRTMD